MEQKATDNKFGIIFPATVTEKITLGWINTRSRPLDDRMLAFKISSLEVGMGAYIKIWSQAFPGSLIVTLSFIGLAGIGGVFFFFKKTSN